MKKAGTVFLCMVILCALFALPVCASNLLEDLKESAGLERIREVLPADLEGFDALDTESFLNEDFLSGVFARLLSSFKEAVRSCAAFFAGILAFLCLSALARSLRHASFSDSVGDAFEFVGVMALAASCYAALWGAFTELSNALTALGTLIGGMLPVTGAIYTLSGAATAAAAQSAGVLSALAVLDALVVSYLFPLLCLSFSLAAANAVSGLKLSSLSRFLRKSVSFLLGAVFTVLLLILSVQTLLGAAGDTLMLRTSRYAAANFVPAVGNLFGEASRSVFAALSVVRTQVGVLGAFAVVWILLTPLLSLGVRRALFSLAAGLAEALDLEREARFLSECGETLGLGLAVALSCGVFFTLSFALFCRVTVGGA